MSIWNFTLHYDIFQLHLSETEIHRLYITRDKFGHFAIFNLLQIFFTLNPLRHRHRLCEASAEQGKAMATRGWGSLSH